MNVLRGGILSSLWGVPIMLGWGLLRLRGLLRIHQIREFGNPTIALGTRPAKDQ